MSDDFISEFQIRSNRSNVMLCGGMLVAVALTHGLGLVAGFNPVWIAVVAATAVVFAFGHHGYFFREEASWVLVGLGTGASATLVVAASGLIGAMPQRIVAFVILAAVVEVVAKGILGTFGTPRLRLAMTAAMNALCLAMWLAANPAVSLVAAPAVMVGMLAYWHWPVRLPAAKPPQDP